MGPNHPIWTSGELHPQLLERKERILGIGREGEHYHNIRAGTLYATSASADKAEKLGYHLYVTSGNRWGVSTSPITDENKEVGDSIDFVVAAKPGGEGARLPADKKGMQETYDILAAAVVAGANGIGWGRDNGAGHHVEVDDAQRGTPGVEDVWPYTDNGAIPFLTFEKDYASKKIHTNPAYQDYVDYYAGKGLPRPNPESVSSLLRLVVL